MSEKPKRPHESGGRKVLPHSGLAEDVIPEGKQDRSAEPAAPQSLYEFADSLQREAESEEDLEKKNQALETWVTFTLDGESFGLPVSHVQEILRVDAITRVPHAPEMVRGVTNMRGRVLPVVDLRVRLRLGEGPISAHSRILVVSSQGRLMGLLVDAVQQVVRLDRLKIQPPPPDVMTAQSDYILGVYHFQKSLAILLDVDRTLTIHDSIQQQSQDQ